MNNENQITVKDTFEYSGSILINDKYPVPRNQFIYGSNSYGTAYSVYAKFNVEKETPDTVEVKIELTLLNYKGIINLGFDKEVDFKYDKDKNELTFFITVKGLANNKVSKPEKTIVLKRNSMLKIVAVRNLLPLNSIENTKNPTVSDCYHEEVFDNEFYYRDGNFHHSRKDFNNMDMEDSIKNNQPKIMQPTIRCRIGNSLAYVL